MKQNDVFNYFTESIQTQILVAEMLNQQIEQIIQKLLSGLLKNKTIFISANDFLMPVAMNFAHQLFNGLEIERPPIPIMPLSPTFLNITQINGQVAHQNEAKQINAFAKPRDILILLSYSGNEPHLISVIQEAIEKELRLILFRPSEAGELSAFLGANDLDIEIPTQSKFNLIEIQTMILNCISQTLEARLFFNNAPL